MIHRYRKAAVVKLVTGLTLVTGAAVIVLPLIFQNSTAGRALGLVWYGVGMVVYLLGCLDLVRAKGHSAGRMSPVLVLAFFFSYLALPVPVMLWYGLKDRVKPDRELPPVDAATQKTYRLVNGGLALAIIAFLGGAFLTARAAQASLAPVYERDTGPQPFFDLLCAGLLVLSLAGLNLAVTTLRRGRPGRAVAISALTLVLSPLIFSAWCLFGSRPDLFWALPLILWLVSRNYTAPWPARVSAAEKETFRMAVTSLGLTLLTQSGMIGLLVAGWSIVDAPAWTALAGLAVLLAVTSIAITVLRRGGGTKPLAESSLKLAAVPLVFFLLVLLKSM